MWPTNHHHNRIWGHAMGQAKIKTTKTLAEQQWAGIILRKPPFLTFGMARETSERGERTKRTQILAFTRQEGFLNYSQQKRRCYKANMGWCEQSYKWFGKTKRKLSCSLITRQHSLRFPSFQVFRRKLSVSSPGGTPHVAFKCWVLPPLGHLSVPICLDKLSINGLPYVLPCCMAPKALGTLACLVHFLSHFSFS